MTQTGEKSGLRKFSEKRRLYEMAQPGKALAMESGV